MFHLVLAFIVTASVAKVESGWLKDYHQAERFIDRTCQDADVAYVEATPVKGKPGLYGAPFRAVCEWE